MFFFPLFFQIFQLKCDFQFDLIKKNYMRYRTRSVISVCLQPWCDRRSDQNKMGLLALPPPLPRWSIPWGAHGEVPRSDTHLEMALKGHSTISLSGYYSSVDLLTPSERVRRIQSSLCPQHTWHQQPPTGHLMTEPRLTVQAHHERRAEALRGGEAWAHRRPRAKRSPVWPGALAGYHFHQGA